MKWFDKLEKGLRDRVRRLENERSAAVMDWLNGKISMTEARAIVGRCNHEIARIAEGAA